MTDNMKQDALQVGSAMQCEAQSIHSTELRHTLQLTVDSAVASYKTLLITNQILWSFKMHARNLCHSHEV